MNVSGPEALILLAIALVVIAPVVIALVGGVVLLVSRTARRRS